MPLNLGEMLLTQEQIAQALGRRYRKGDFFTDTNGTNRAQRDKALQAVAERLRAEGAKSHCSVMLKMAQEIRDALEAALQPQES